jgi:hypothetical protein
MWILSSIDLPTNRRCFPVRVLGQRAPDRNGVGHGVFSPKCRRPFVDADAGLRDWHIVNESRAARSCRFGRGAETSRADEIH